MRDCKIDDVEEVGPSYSLIFAVGLSVATFVYSIFMSNPELLARVPGVSHYQGKHYEKTNEQKRLDAQEDAAPAHANISDVDRDALRMLLEANK